MLYNIKATFCIIFHLFDQIFLFNIKNMKRKSLNWTLLAGTIGLITLLSGCLPNDVEEQEKAEKTKLDNYINTHGYNETNNIGNRIYLKFTESSPRTGLMPKKGQTVIVTFTGKYTDGTTFIETTDSTLGAEKFPGRYVVYGPHKLVIGNVLSGVDSCLRRFHEGDEGEMVIPSKFAYYNYEPVVYTFKLLKIELPSDSAYEDTLFNNFRDNHPKFSDELFSGVYYSGNKRDFDINTPVIGADCVDVEIQARYVEDYYPTHYGRIFFPLNGSPKEITWLYGKDGNFPIDSVIEKTLKYMHIKDTMEVICPSNLAYGTTGFFNPYLGVPIVPPNTALHYNLIYKRMYDINKKIWITN
jgi:FKBP-type peptidyl-prolyl cis-trans isomerase